MREKVRFWMVIWFSFVLIIFGYSRGKYYKEGYQNKKGHCYKKQIKKIKGKKIWLTYKRQGNIITLRWEKVKGDNVAGYKVVRSCVNSDPYYPEDSYRKWITNLDQTSYTEKIPSDGKTYYYRICVLPHDFYKIKNEKKVYKYVACSNVIKVKAYANKFQNSFEYKTPQTSSSQDTSFYYCPYCGKRIKSSFKYCPYCGKYLKK